MDVKQVYVPVGFRGLEAWVLGDRSAHPGWGVAPDMGGVTEADEAEQRHYEALWVAAETPEARAVTKGKAEPGRVVVFTVQVPANTPEDEHGVVDLTGPLSAADVVCAHVHEVGADEQDELLWFDPSEFSGLVPAHTTP